MADTGTKSRKFTFSWSQSTKICLISIFPPQIQFTLGTNLVLHAFRSNRSRKLFKDLGEPNKFRLTELFIEDWSKNTFLKIDLHSLDDNFKFKDVVLEVHSAPDLAARSVLQALYNSPIYQYL